MSGRTPTAWAATCVAAALVLAPPVARGHGRFPATVQIAFHPTEPDVMVVGTTFGVLVTQDGGEQWRWICQQVTGAQETEDPVLAVTPDGSILGALVGGMARGAELGCDWGFPSTALEGVVVADQAQHPTEPGSHFAVTASEAQDNLVYRSDDQGVTWAATGQPIGPVLFEGMEIAPSDADRIYLSGSPTPSAEGPQPHLYRSADGGLTWTAVPVQPFGPSDQAAVVLGVDPTDSDHLFLRVMGEEDDRLVRSTDGGDSWSVALSIPGVHGFAWSSDGFTIWAGGGDGAGLWRSDDGGDSFLRVGDQDIRCLAVRGDALWACGNDFVDGFAVGRSTDGGHGFEPVLRLQDIAGMVECGAESPTTQQCEPLLADLVQDLGLEDAHAGSPDAGARLGGGSEGCGCVAAGAAPRNAPAPALSVGLLALAALLVLPAARVRRRLRLRRPRSAS